MKVFSQALLGFQTFVMPEHIQAVHMRKSGEVDVYGSTQQWLLNRTSARVSHEEAIHPVFIRSHRVPLNPSVFKVFFDDLRMQHIISTSDGTHLLRLDEYPQFVTADDVRFIASLSTSNLVTRDFRCSDSDRIAVKAPLVAGSLSGDVLFAIAEDCSIRAVDWRSGDDIHVALGDRISVSSMKAFRKKNLDYILIGSTSGHLRLYRWMRDSGFQDIGVGECSLPPECLDICDGHVVISNGHTLIIDRFSWIS